MNVSDQVITEQYALYCGDCCAVLKGVADSSIHLSIYSPPFLPGYTSIQAIRAT